MSFFYDFLDYFKIEDASDKTTLLTFVGVGMVIVGKVSIADLSDSFVELKSDKEKILIYGENLLIKSISKGEVVIEGKVLKTEFEDAK